MSHYTRVKQSGRSVRNEIGSLQAELDELHAENEQLRERLIVAEAVCETAGPAIHAIKEHLKWSVNMLMRPVPPPESVVTRHDQETLAATLPFKEAREAWLRAKRVAEYMDDDN